MCDVHVHDLQGDFEKSVQYFSRCYELCRQLNDPVALHEARVQYGIARGHQLFQEYSGNVASGENHLESLIAWKDGRVTASKRPQNTEEPAADEDDDGSSSGNEQCERDSGSSEDSNMTTT